MKKNQFDLFLFSTIGVVLCLIIVIGFNIIASFAKYRWDLTEDGLFTFSEGTKEILDELEKPVEIRFYATRDSKLMHPQLKNYVGRVEDMIDEFAQHNQQKINVKKFDPQPDSDAEELAKSDGVRGGRSISSPDPIYLGLAVSMFEKTSAIPFLDPSKERYLEYEIIRAISQVTSVKKPVVGVISFLPVFGESPNPMTPQLRRSPEEPWVVISQLRSDFEVRRINTTAESIDEDITVLLVIHPKGLSETTEYALDQFVLRGGKLIAFLDARSEVDQAPNPNRMTASPPSTSNLPRLLSAWGLFFDDSKVVADTTFATQFSSRQGVYPSFLSISDLGIHSEDITTDQIDEIQMLYAGTFSGTAVEGLEQTILVHTTENARLVDGIDAHLPERDIPKDSELEKKEYPLVLRLSGKFKTAFPEGKPVPEDFGEDEVVEDEIQSEKSEKGNDHNEGNEDQNEDVDDQNEDQNDGEEDDFLTEGEGTVVLFGDADFMFDPLAVIPQNFFGSPTITFRNGNLPIIQNTVDQLAGDSRLIRVRSRGAKNRPFKKIDDMHEQAEKDFSEDIEILEKKLEETQKKLNELQSERTDDNEGQRFVLSPEQQAELENFRKQEAETNKELKAKRRNLRRAIDALETKLKWLNIAAMPAIITIGGILIAIIKRKRTAAR